MHFPRAGSFLPILFVLLLLSLEDTPVWAGEGLFEEMPVVLSATRLRQSVRDAPISMTVIDRQMIEASGFTEIPDLMRLVPGFVVDYDSGHLPVTGYHMLHDRYVRHQQVLIDGRSVYTPILGGVPWVDLPITLDDIERIEVVRGPNAASYGSNSFMGVINIITRDSALDRGTSVKTNIGDNGLREGFLRYGNNLGDMDYVFSFGYREDHGFKKRHDSKEVKMVTFRGDYQVNNRDSLIFQMGYNGGTRQEDNSIRPDEYPDYERQVNSQYQQVRWIRALPDYGELRLQYYRTAINEEKDYITNDQNYDTERHDLELQHTFNVGEKVRVAWGGSYRRDRSESDYFVIEQAPEYINIGRVFANMEYRHSRNLVINGGLMIEDNDLAGVDYLPRLGINYHLSPRDTVRASVSRATREPVLTEEYPYLDDILPGGFYWENDVEPEYITAYELGYLTETRDGAINADLKLFYEDVTDLILYDDSAPDGTYWFNNFDDVAIKGLEAQITLRPSDRARVHIAFSRTSIDSTNVAKASAYDRAAPRNSLSILGMWQFKNNYSGSLGFYKKDGHKNLAVENDTYKPYKRVDMRLAKKFGARSRQQELAVVVQNVFDEVQESRLHNFPERRFYVSYKLDFE
ncbi:TonB-dependent receptor plug domain-containing protein [Thiohalophilus sp.]|uniref:TonB-dependent receptor plug domain-containing protein n=1 Tax=Thiohalophilus sp. TaxID=3028392 RepID=UPI002ACD9D6F|nr:TonB-dependent receptor [Thiohalophilus sp.]MDZ7661335.1 TonB-dependent receptor [Thiohalophilus sp.]MDZ7803096.1 TonB-dependent receptor [Thiohalophilus sp.]